MYNGVFRIYKGEKAGVRLTLVPSHKDVAPIRNANNRWHRQLNPCCRSDLSTPSVTRFHFCLTVEALNWPANTELPATVNRAEVITTWLTEISAMPKHVTIAHRLANNPDSPGAVTEWYNNVCVAKYGCDDTTETMGLFWGTDNLKAAYAVVVTEYGVNVDLTHQLKDIREFSEENFKKYGVLTPQDPNVHGPTPWRIFDPGKDDPWRELSIVDANNNGVTTLGPLEDTTDMTLGNALFILRCCNEFDRLLMDFTEAKIKSDDDEKRIGELKMTIGQLEAEADKLRKERDELQRRLDEVKGEV